MTDLVSQNILGVRISVTTYEDAIAYMEECIRSPRQVYVCESPVHSVVTAVLDPEFQEILNEASMTLPDGMPLVWLANHRGGRRMFDRVYGPTLMLKFCEVAAHKEYRQFFYGGAAGVAQKLQETLTRCFPGLQVVGAYCPPFRPLTPEEDQGVVRMINGSGADVVWVGLGAPKQERWMAEHLGQIKAPVMVGVGAAFDFHTGRVKQAPPWMQKYGLEWAYRLYREPRRLWKRYLMSNSLFVWYLLLEKMRLKTFPKGDVPQ